MVGRPDEPSARHDPVIELLAHHFGVDSSEMRSEGADSVANGKPYLAEATRQGFEPFDPAAQVRTGPVLQPNPPVIRYAIRPKTQAELDAERALRIEGHVTPALMALAKRAGLTRAQFKVLIEAEL